MLNPRKVWIARLADPLLRLLFRLSGQASRPVPQLDPDLQVDSILLLESHLLGDTVMAQPLIARLKERFPGARIELFAHPWAVELYEQEGGLSAVTAARFPWVTGPSGPKAYWTFLATVLRLRRKRFGLAIDPRGDLRNIFLLWLAGARFRLGVANSGGTYLLTHLAPGPAAPLHLLQEKFLALAPLGIHYAGEAPVLTARPESAAWVTQQWPRQGRPRVVIHPGASQAARRMTVDQALTIVKGCQDRGFEVILAGTPAESDFCQLIAGRAAQPVALAFLPLTRLMALLAASDHFVGTDSGPAHVAAALGVPTLALVEAAKAGLTAPQGAHCLEVCAHPGAGIPDIDPLRIAGALERLFAIPGRSRGSLDSPEDRLEPIEFPGAQ